MYRKSTDFHIKKKVKFCAEIGTKLIFTPVFLHLLTNRRFRAHFVITLKFVDDIISLAPKKFEGSKQKMI